MPYISVIIPIYNVEDYLRECVDSVIEQDFQDIEIILVDDGSNDTCPEICDFYARKDARIKVIHKKNGGAADTRNCGLLSATGNYVLFLDADDYWDFKAFLSQLTERAKTTTPDFLMFSHKKKKNGEISAPASHFDMSKIIPENMAGTLSYLFSSAQYTISACLKLINRKFLIDNQIFFEKGLLCEDIDWGIKILTYAKHIDAINLPCYVYRMRENSSSHNVGEKQCKDIFKILNRWAYYIKNEAQLEKDIQKGILGYLCFEYLLLIGFSCGVKDSKSKKELFKQLKSLKWLLEYDINKKTHYPIILIRFIGIKAAAYVLNFYISRR